MYTLFFTVIDARIPLVIQGLVSCLILLLDGVLNCACLFIILLNLL